MRALSTQSSTLLIDDNASVPTIIYFGPLLSQPITEQVLSLTKAAIPQGGLDIVPEISIASTHADASFMNPALKIHCGSTLWAPQWQLRENEASENEICFRLTDRKTGLTLNWCVLADHTNDVFTINTSIENKGDHPIELAQWLTTLPISRSFDTVTSFSGRWIQEFQPQHYSVPLGSLEFTNLKGRTSHDHFPGLLLSQGTPSNFSGDVIGCHLGWSGNHQQRIESSQNGLQQYQAGVALIPGEVVLSPGNLFEAAPLYFTHSTTGLAGIGANFQRFVRANILKFPEDKPRPVHINTWEALYFNHNQSDLDSLAEAGKAIGAERYVLDDGWFLGRRDDTAGLGDWVIDESVYPNALNPLKATLKKHGLGFGLWFEPEMVNKESELFRQHPDWILELEEQIQPAGRNQWVLDITRQEVQDYLYGQISDLLRDYPIEYIKWDMNRDLLQAGNQQGKPVYYTYVKSLYRLIDRVRENFPLVEIESCASGGGRMDYGILKRTHRFWLSDCNDAKERQRMQQWASIFFPAEVLGSHVGPTHSHTTSRSHHLEVRAGTALFGHMGIEWDVRNATEQEQSQLADLIGLYKQERQFIHSNVRRPINGAEQTQTAFCIGDDKDILISVFQSEMPTVSVPGGIKIPAVNEEYDYQIEILIAPENTGHLMKQKPDWMENPQKISGELLKKIGLALPVLDPETLIVIKLIKAE